jgi:hypothetical protein
VDEKPFVRPPKSHADVLTTKKGQSSSAYGRDDKENEDPMSSGAVGAGAASNRGDAKTPARKRKSNGGSAPSSRRTPLADITPLKDEDGRFTSNSSSSNNEGVESGEVVKKVRKKTKKSAASNASTSKNNGSYGLQHRPPTHLNFMFAASVR